MKFLFASVCVFLALVSGAFADDWSQVSKEIAAWQQHSQNESRRTLRLLQEEKAELTGLRAGLETRVTQKQQPFDTLKVEYDELLAQEKAYTEYLNAEEYEFKTMDGVLRSAREKFFAGVRGNRPWVRRRAIILLCAPGKASTGTRPGKPLHVSPRTANLEIWLLTDWQFWKV